MSPREILTARFKAAGVSDRVAAKSAVHMLLELKTSGFVVVPRSATDEIAMVDPRYPCRELWARMVETAEATKP